MYYPSESVERLVKELSKLPGIGPKSAQRLAFHLLKISPENANRLAQAIVEVKEKVRYCSVCCNFTEVDPCEICQDSKRDRSVVCVVEKPSDMVSIDKSGTYNGLYHVLHGTLAPLEGKGPEDIRTKELLKRLEGGKVAEVILATNPNVEGQATAIYLMKIIKPLSIKVTRIAQGIPMGSDLEFADEVTLSMALEGRREMQDRERGGGLDKGTATPRGRPG